MESELARLHKRLLSTNEALIKTKQEYAEVTGQIAKSSTEISRLSQEMAKSNTNVAKQEAVLSKISANATRLGESFAKVTAQQRAFNQVQRVTQQTTKTLSSDITRVATAQDHAAAAATRASYAQKRYADATRTALSWSQRIRGQLLSLAAAYTGVFGAVQFLGNTVRTFKTIENTMNRLNVVFQGDQKRSAQELDFLRRTADRLGYSVGTLADEYSKLAVAAMGTELEGQNLRKVFISMAEAARVNGLSLEDMRYAFLAVQQIITKQNVYMEELRQQLAERFPGAIQMMAEGLGYGKDRMDEFFKAVQNGEVKAIALLAMADKLQQKFGPQLGRALMNTTAQIGFFENAVFKLQLAFAQGGFLEGFTDALARINTVLQSGEFISFVQRLSKAIAVLADAVAWLVENFRILIDLFSWFIGVKIAQSVVTSTAAFAGLLSKLAPIGKYMTRFVAVAVRAGAVLPAVIGGVKGLAVAMRLLFSTTLPGAALTVILGGAAIALGRIATSSNKATIALKNHTDVLDKMKNEMDSAGKLSETFIDKLATENLGKQTEAVSALREEYGRLLTKLTEVKAKRSLFSADSLLAQDISNKAKAPVYAEINSLIAAYKNGSLEAEKFIERLQDIAKVDPKLARNVVNPMIQMVFKSRDAKQNLDLAEASLRILKKTATEADYQLVALANTMKGLGLSSEGVANKFKDTADKIRAYLPDMKKMLDTQAAQKELESLISSYNTLKKEVETRGLAQGDSSVAQSIRQQLEGMEEVIRKAREYAANPDLAKQEEESRKEAEKKADAIKEFRKEVQASISDMKFEASIQSKSAIDQEIAKVLQEKINAAKKLGIKLTESEVAGLREAVVLLYEQKNARDDVAKAEEKVEKLTQKRAALEGQLAVMQARGDYENVTKLQDRIKALNDQLVVAIDNAIKFYAAMGGEDADGKIEQFRQMRLETEQMNIATEKMYLSWQDVGSALSGGMVDFMDSFAQAVVETGEAFSSLKDSFLSFASSFLQMIAKMIAQQAILKMFSSFGWSDMAAGAGHTGGVVGSKRIGSANRTKRVSPFVFSGAQAFHSGGLPGLSANEVPAILKKGEEVLSESDPRNILNGGLSPSGGGTTLNTRIVNAIDAPSFLSEALNSSVGEKVLLNYIKANSGAVRSALR
jgi:tape measure domain-containing protein